MKRPVRKKKGTGKGEEGPPNSQRVKALCLNLREQRVCRIKKEGEKPSGTSRRGKGGEKEKEGEPTGSTHKAGTADLPSEKTVSLRLRKKKKRKTLVLG